MNTRPATLWSSILKANKAVQSGLAAAAIIVGGVFAVDPDPDWKAFLLAIPAYLVNHVITYRASNVDPEGDIKKAAVALATTPSTLAAASVLTEPAGFITTLEDPDPVTDAQLSAVGLLDGPKHEAE